MKYFHGVEKAGLGIFSLSLSLQSASESNQTRTRVSLVGTLHTLNGKTPKVIPHNTILTTGTIEKEFKTVKR